jgi:hypothetical protein
MQELEVRREKKSVSARVASNVGEASSTLHASLRPIGSPSTLHHVLIYSGGDP